MLWNTATTINTKYDIAFSLHISHFHNTVIAPLTIQTWKAMKSKIDATNFNLFLHLFPFFTPTFLASHSNSNIIRNNVIFTSHTFNFSNLSNSTLVLVYKYLIEIYNLVYI